MFIFVPNCVYNKVSTISQKIDNKNKVFERPECQVKFLLCLIIIINNNNISLL